MNPKMMMKVLEKLEEDEDLKKKAMKGEPIEMEVIEMIPISKKGKPQMEEAEVEVVDAEPMYGDEDDEDDKYSPHIPNMLMDMIKSKKRRMKNKS